MVSRLIDLPFTRGLDESTDDTALAPPGMTEMVNYRLTRAGRLEHRLGVSDFPLSSAVFNFTGDRPEGNKPQALYQRFLAAGGHGYTCLTTGVWACVGSLSRFVPTESYKGLQGSSVTFTSPSCTSVSGFLVTAGRQTGGRGGVVVNIFDEATGALMYEEQRGTAGANTAYPRVIASGTKAVLVRMDLTTGDIIGCSLDLSVFPITGFSADVTIVAGATVAAGFDAAPLDTGLFAISYYNGVNAIIRAIQTSGFAVSFTGAATDGAGAKLTTCLTFAGAPVRYFLAWLNTTTRSVAYAVFDATMVQIGATVVLGSAPGTVFSADNFHPVIGRRDTNNVVVGWTDSYLNGSFQTYRTTFRDATDAGIAGSTYGPIYGYYLASKPFRASTAFVEGIAQPAVWLGNHNPNVTDLDRSYFLMLLGSFTTVTDNQACSWELSASPSAAVDAAFTLGAQTQVCEVVQSTTVNPVSWETLLQESFRGLGTATPQRKLQVYRFGDAAKSQRARTRAIVPCQGSFAVLGGAPRYYDSDRLVELGMAHSIAVIAATPAATGSMTPSGVYRYIFTLEYFDGQGQRQIGYATNPYKVTLGAGDAQVNFELLACSMWAHHNATSTTDTRQIVVRAYRTSNNGVVYRYAGETVYPNGYPAGPLIAFGRIQFQDVNGDSQIAGNAAVYTQVGNSLSNYRAPPCRFGCVHEGRLIVAGGWNPYEYIASKLIFPGEGIQFTEAPQFRDTCDEPITGVASLDGTLILFSERGIFAVVGDGPTDDGAGSFAKPRRLPGRVGCVDWRSIVTTEEGVYFRAADGMRMLPRGLSSTVFVGAAIKEKLRAYPETLGAATVTRSVASTVSDHDSEQVICWLVGVGTGEEPTAVKIFTFTPATQFWAEVQLPSDVSNLQHVVGVWQDITNRTDVLGFARETISTSVQGSLLVENPASGYDRDIDASYEPLLAGSWKTGKVFPFGFGGRGTIRALRLVGDCLAPTTLTPTVYSDMNTAGYVSSALTFSAGRFAVEIPLRQRDIEWIQIAVADPTAGSGNRGAGLRFNGMALEVEMDPGLIRSPAANRSI